MDPIANHSAAHRDLVMRALDSGKLDMLQVWFEAAVLERYRGDPDCRILRSDSAGRLRGPGNWLINFGIAPDESLIHLALSSLTALPETHRPHWLAHLVGLPVGENFLRMVVNPTACLDDGDSRDW